MSSCSKRSCSAISDGTDSAACTRGRRSASRPRRSSSTTSRSSAAGIQPPERTWISPICTGAPRERLAIASMRGRHSPIRGKIPQCRISHAASSRLHISSNVPTNSRKARVDQRHKEPRDAMTLGAGDIE
jgi:hypothetical protein